MSRWYRLLVGKHELDLGVILKCGQAFRWSEVSPREWVGVIDDSVWLLKQDEEYLYYKVFPDNNQLGVKQPQPNDQTDSTDKVKQPQPNDQTDSTDKVKQPQPNDQTDSTDKVKQPQPNDQTDSTDKKVKLHKRQGKISRPNSNIKKIKIESAVIETNKDLLNKVNLNSNDVTKYPVIVSNPNFEKVVKDYFRLDINLVDLYMTWSQTDVNFKEMIAKYPGIRLLRQDPVENLFTFICSSNNHISRITSMVDKMCVEYGDKIADIEGKSYYTFARVDRLAEDGVEEKLRELGFGYRASYIHKTARYIMDQGDGVQWLYGLREETYAEAKRSLMLLHGVGAKVADCVCLMSLDKMEAVPVDTHVWQISKMYLPSLAKHKSITDKVYSEIGDYFRELWGAYAGWAQAVLFAADLPQFKRTKDKK